MPIGVRGGRLSDLGDGGQQHTAVNQDAGAGHVAGIVRGEVDGGARDIGLPGARAAVRARNGAAAAEWVGWALRAFPRIRAEIAADRELAPLLERAGVRAGTEN